MANISPFTLHTLENTGNFGIYLVFITPFNYVYFEALEKMKYLTSLSKKKLCISDFAVVVHGFRHLKIFFCNKTYNINIKLSIMVSMLKKPIT